MDLCCTPGPPCLFDPFAVACVPRTNGVRPKDPSIDEEEDLFLIQEARDAWYQGVDEEEYQITEHQREYDVLPTAKAFEVYREYKLPRHKRWLGVALPNVHTAIISAVVSGSVSLLMT